MTRGPIPNDFSATSYRAEHARRISHALASNIQRRAVIR
jgi:hypothetical protein